MKRALLWLVSLIARRFDLRLAPQLVTDHRSCTFCAGPVCRSCRQTIRYEATAGEFCSERCQRIEAIDRVPDHKIKPFSTAFDGMGEVDGPHFGTMNFGDD